MKYFMSKVIIMHAYAPHENDIFQKNDDRYVVFKSIYKTISHHFQFTEVMFVDEKSKQKTAFTKSGSPVTFTGNYDKKANAYGLWTAQGVASTQYKYQMLICDTSVYKGLHFSGFTKSCYKQCNHWCHDTLSPYFRTAAVANPSFKGVAFNKNGHRSMPNRLISAGIR